jgi:hypothetical protein
LSRPAPPNAAIASVSPSNPEAHAAVADASLDEAVGEEQQRPALRQCDRALLPQLVLAEAERQVHAVDRQLGGRAAVGQHGRGVAGQPDVGAAAVGGDDDERQGGEDVGPVALGDEHLLERGQDLGGRALRERQRAPGDAQADAERRLVGAVAADVADRRVQRAVGQLDDVVEVAAQDGAAAAGPVAGGQAQLRVAQERRGQQPAFQAGVLLGLQLRSSSARSERSARPRAMA